MKHQTFKQVVTAFMGRLKRAGLRTGTLIVYESDRIAEWRIKMQRKESLFL